MHKLRNAFIIAAITSGLALIAWLFRPIEPSILDHATKVADVRAWGKAGCWSFPSIGVGWFSDHELFFDRFLGIARTGTVYKRNRRTGIETQLADLTRNLAVLGRTLPDSRGFSPDGKWYAHSNRFGDCLLAEVNGARKNVYKTGNKNYYRQILWSSDGHKWMEAFYSTTQSNTTAPYFVLHDTQNPRISTTVPSCGDGFRFAGNGIGQPNDRSMGIALDATSVTDRDIWVIVREYHIGKTITTRSITTLIPPNNSPDFAYQISPDGKQVIWETHSSKPERFTAILHRILPSVKPEQDWYFELWVQQTNGTGLRKLGSMRKRRVIDGSFRWLGFGWLPDSAHISIFDNGSLYSLPIRSGGRDNK